MKFQISRYNGFKVGIFRISPISRCSLSFSMCIEEINGKILKNRSYRSFTKYRIKLGLLQTLAPALLQNFINY